MSGRKSVLTTGEVAKICSVAPRTVSKWFDSGQLRGYRIPGSKDRRIPLEQLVRFMRAHRIPLNGLDTGLTRVLILDSDETLADTLASALHTDGGYEVVTASTAFEAGARMQDFRPQVLTVDVTLPDVEPRSLSRFVRSAADLEEICLVGVAPRLSEGDGQALLQSGFDGYLSKPFAVRDLIELIDKRLSAAAEHIPRTADVGLRGSQSI